MRLRNKKTGKVLRVGEDVYIRSLDSGSIEVREDFGCGNKIEYFKTFAKMFERYEEIKEPLIKDEKVRKAVRTWAEASEVNPQMIKASIGTRCTKFIGWRKDETHGIGIEFRNLAGIENIADGEPYTLAELCGEEEE